MQKNVVVTFSVVVSLLASLFLPLLSSTDSIQAAPPLPPTSTPTRPPANPDETGQPSHTLPTPNGSPYLPDVEVNRAKTAMEGVLQKYLDYWGPRYQTAPLKISVDGEWAHGVAEWTGDAALLKEPLHILARRLPNGTWQALMPGTDGAFLQWLATVPTTFLATSEREQLVAQASQIDNLYGPKVPPVAVPLNPAILPTEPQPVASGSAISRVVTFTNNLTSQTGHLPLKSAPDIGAYYILYAEERDFYALSPDGRDSKYIGAEFAVPPSMLFDSPDVIYQTDQQPDIVLTSGYDFVSGLMSPSGGKQVYVEAICLIERCLPIYNVWQVDVTTHQRRLLFDQTTSKVAGHLPQPVAWRRDGSAVFFDTFNLIRNTPFAGVWGFSFEDNDLFQVDMGAGSYNSRFWLSPDRRYALLTGAPGNLENSDAAIDHPTSQIKMLDLATGVITTVASNPQGTEYSVRGLVLATQLPILREMARGKTQLDVPVAVLEATSGFQRPMTNDHYGYAWLDWTGSVYHPGDDYNGPGAGNADCDTDIYAVADGTVRYVNLGGWGTMIVEHSWQGITVYSQYGHLASVLVSTDQNVTKGQHIAEMGNTGTTYCHLHWEVREADHPDPTNGSYYTTAVLKIRDSVENYYEDPEWWVDNHGPYDNDCNNPGPNSDQIGLYEHSNYCGSYKLLGIGEYANPGAMGFGNDSASSIKVGGNVKGILCKDVNYGGGCEEFTGDDPDLGDNPTGDNTVSSIKVQSRYSCNPNADQIALFVDPNYGGQCVVKGIGDYTNPGAIGLPNDSISSIKVGGNVKANLCRDDNYAGGCETFTGDDNDLGGNSIGNDQVSSVKVEARSSSCSPGADQIALYVDPNYAGQCIVKGLGDYPNPGTIGLPNDAISSVRVGGNVKATLCRDDNYAGGCEVFTGDDNDLNGNSIGNDQVSSAKVEPRIQLPAAPNLQSPGNGNVFNEGDSINLSWSATGDDYYGEIWGGPGGLLTFGWRGGTSENIGSQWAGYTYSWHVKARNGAGESGWSSTWTFTVRPGAPSNLTAQAPSCSQVNLYWNDNSGNEEGFRIYRGGSYLAQVGSAVTNYQDTGLSGNASYTYYITAYRGGIESNPSNTVAITTPGCPPPQPDLVPSQWSGWQYPIVPASITGTVIVNTLYAGWPTYIDWGLSNSGGTATGGTTYGSLYVDDVRVGHYDFGDVTPGITWAFFDWWEMISTPGWHTLKSVADPDNLIAESDETNNVFERQFYWMPVAPYLDDMESGSNEWTATGLWHQVDVSSPYPAAHSPSHSWWYGQDATGTYDTGSRNSGDLTSPPVYIPANGYYLRFWYRYQTETQATDWDQRWIQISVDDGPFSNVLQLYDDPRLWWLRGQVIDLSGYAGHVIRVRFFFDTLDGFANNYRGWYIDDVDISTTPPPACTDVFESNNTATAATVMGYGQTFNADICPGGDYDWYAFAATAGDKIVVDVDAAINGSWLDPYVFLIDSDGTTVLAENDDEIMGDVTDSHLGYHLPHDGTYYIKVRAWNHPSAGGPDYDYAIRLLTDNIDPSTAQITFPESLAWLNPITTTTTVVATDNESGINRVEFLWHSSDWENTNWIWLGADQDGRDGWGWDFDSSGLPDQQGGAFYIWAFDWAGNWTGAGVWGLGVDHLAPTTAFTLGAMYDDAPFRDFHTWWNGSDNLSGVARYDVQYRDEAGGTWTDLLVNTTDTYYRFVGEVGHTYYFRIRARDYAGNESAYSSGEGDAHYTIQNCPTSPDAYEPDAAFTTARLITTDGLSQTHTFHVEGDQDWVKFYAAAGVTYTLATTNTGGHADTVVSLYDTNGTAQLASNDDYPGLGWASQLDWVPTLSGMYYAQVAHWDVWAYGCTTEYGLSIVANDSVAPAGSITLGGGAVYATSSNISLTLTASDTGTGVEQMMLSNSNNFAGASWQPYAAAVAWVLPGGDGPKTVYARFRDRAGNLSTVYADTITLDTTAPAGSVTIEGGAAMVTHTHVLLTISGSDANGVADMRLRGDAGAWGAWEPYATSHVWLLPQQAGQHSVSIQFRDAAGNVSMTYSDAIDFQWPFNLHLPLLRR